MIVIQLTKGYCAIVDDADAQFAQLRWCANIVGRNVYAVRRQPKTRRTQALHRAIAAAAPHELVDHIDGDTLNNRRSNLRICSRQQNAWNQQGRTGTSKFKGVCKPKNKNFWVARITVDGRTLHLGCFSTQEQAALAYNDAATRHFESFARPNQLDCS